MPRPALERLSAGTGNVPAWAHDRPAGLRARSCARATSQGAHAPWSASGSGWVRTSSPASHVFTPEPTATTTPAASTPSAIGGVAPTSQLPARTMSSQLPTPAAFTSISTSSSRSGRGSATSRIWTAPPNFWIPATRIGALIMNAAVTAHGAIWGHRPVPHVLRLARRHLGLEQGGWCLSVSVKAHKGRGNSALGCPARRFQAPRQSSRRLRCSRRECLRRSALSSRLLPSERKSTELQLQITARTTPGPRTGCCRPRCRRHRRRPHRRLGPGRAPRPRADRRRPSRARSR